MRVPYERVDQDIYDDDDSAFDGRPFEPSKSAFHDSRFPLSPRSSSASSIKSCCINGVTSGRLPLCLVLLLILGFLLWHVETEPRRTQETLASLTTAENHLVETTEQHELISVNPRARLPVKDSYRVLLIGDSLTVGYYYSPANHSNHPYLLHLQELLSARHPRLHFEFTMEAEGGECVISACTRRSLLERVTDLLKDPSAGGSGYFDLAIIMGGTNDIFHDLSASDVSHGLESLHSLVWNQSPPKNDLHTEGAVAHVQPKTIALTIPQFGDTEAWRPPKRQTKLSPAVAASARTIINSNLIDLCQVRHAEVCTLVNLDHWFPRRSLAPRELHKLWAENVHPTPAGYDEIGLVVYQHIHNILPLN